MIQINAESTTVVVHEDYSLSVNGFAHNEPDPFRPDVPSEVQDLFAKYNLMLFSKDQFGTEQQRQYNYGVDTGKTQKHNSLEAAIKEYFKDIAGDVEAGNDLLEHLGMSKITSEYIVHVVVDGTDVLTIRIEADDEEDAVRLVEDDWGPSEYEVEIEFEYNGDGTVEESDTICLDTADLYSDVNIWAEEAL